MFVSFHFCRAHPDPGLPPRTARFGGGKEEETSIHSATSKVLPQLTEGSQPRGGTTLWLRQQISRIYNSFVSWVGAGLNPFGMTAIIWELYQPRMMDDDECGAVGGMIGRENRSTRRKPALFPFCPPWIPHDLIRARTRSAAVQNQLLIAWAMTRPQLI
jgi:hypothetical protein